MKTESNIIDAIESLIREPYGCFEQCSSVTYPLVMLLKYLRWAPKTDKIIKMVQDADDKQRYERVIGKTS